MENGVQEKQINKQRAYGLMLDIFGGAPYSHPIHEFRNLKNYWKPTSEQDFEDAKQVIARLREEVIKAAQVNEYKDILNVVELDNIMASLTSIENEINNKTIAKITKVIHPNLIKIPPFLNFNI